LKKAIKVIAFLISLFLILVLFPIVKLALTDAKVTKSIFMEQYYVKVSSDEYDFDVFREYMKDKGWKEVKRLGGLHVFEKNGKKKGIVNTQIKKVFIDGKLNFKFRYFF